MSDKVFVDTNILVYAHDMDAGKKHVVSKEVISNLWESRTGVLSIQVLQEFYVTLTRKIPSPIEKAFVRRVIQNYLSWQVVVNDGPILLQASEIEETHNLSFWDALIVSAAFSANAAKIITEDFNSGQVIEGITIINPFGG
jgi:predicted nucleic acid-binding protein